MNLAHYFACRTRDDGSTFVTLKDSRPDWLYDAVRDAHDGEMPNDWRYDTCYHIAGCIDDGMDDAAEIADSLVDVYVSDLIAWLTPDRLGYCDEWAEDFGATPDTTPGVAAIIRGGQFLCIERMAQIMLDAAAENGGEL